MFLRVFETPADAATDAADLLARRVRRAVRDRGRASIAVSGGRGPAAMFVALAARSMPWERLHVFQVDERVAPAGSPDRNARLLDVLPLPAGNVHLMPVEQADLESASSAYARLLPERFDVVHLGIGDDGHTASWAPGDPVIDEQRAVGVTGTFNGFVRMTLTPGVVNAARSRIVLVDGATKAPAVRRWLLDDPTVPVQRLRRQATTVVLDDAAASELTVDRQ